MAKSKKIDESNKECKAGSNPPVVISEKMHDMVLKDTIERYEIALSHFENPKVAFYTALSEFQSVLPVIEKNKTVTVQMKSGGKYDYKYADLSEIWKTIREPFTSCGFSHSHKIHRVDNRNVLTTKIMHKCGHEEEATLLLEYTGNDIKTAGGAITYWRRYALSAILGIVSDEDANDIMIDENDEQFVKGLTNEQLMVVESSIVRLPELEKTFRSLYGEISKIPEESFDGVCDLIKSHEKESFLKKYGMDRERTKYHEFIEFVMENTPSKPTFEDVLDRAIEKEEDFMKKFKQWDEENG